MLALENAFDWRLELSALVSLACELARAASSGSVANHGPRTALLSDATQMRLSRGWALVVALSTFTASESELALPTSLGYVLALPRSSSRAPINQTVPRAASSQCSEHAF